MLLSVFLQAPVSLLCWRWSRSGRPIRPIDSVMITVPVTVPLVQKSRRPTSAVPTSVGFWQSQMGHFQPATIRSTPLRTWRTVSTMSVSLKVSQYLKMFSGQNAHYKYNIKDWRKCKLIEAMLSWVPVMLMCLCVCPGAKQVLCDSLKSYADACLSEEVKVDPRWRMVTKCRKLPSKIIFLWSALIYHEPFSEVLAECGSGKLQQKEWVTACCLYGWKKKWR